MYAGQEQVITESAVSTKYIEKMYVTVQHYYFVECIGTWFQFLHVTMDMCKERPGLCPIRPGNISISDQHQPLSRITPFGMYRSKQTFYNPKGEILGCVCLDLPYVR